MQDEFVLILNAWCLRGWYQLPSRYWLPDMVKVSPRVVVEGLWLESGICEQRHFWGRLNALFYAEWNCRISEVVSSDEWRLFVFLLDSALLGIVKASDRIRDREKTYLWIIFIAAVLMVFKDKCEYKYGRIDNVWFSAGTNHLDSDGGNG